MQRSLLPTATPSPWARPDTPAATLRGRALHHWRRTPVGLRWGAAAGAVVLAVVLFFVFIFQWNWLRGPLAGVISGRLHRTVSISGDLEVHPWSWSPQATVNGLTIGNPSWAGAGPMITFPRLTVSISVPQLLRGRVLLPLVSAQAPSIHLIRDAAGRANWNFSGVEPPPPLRLPPIRHFMIDDGHLKIDDAQRKLVFTGTVTSNERAIGAGRGLFALIGQGTLNAEAFDAQVSGGPLLNVDPSRAYPFELHMRAGATHASAKGVIPHPFDLGRFSAQVRVGGQDLSRLNQLTGLALPATPPYDISGSFARVGHNVALRALTGRVGDSDVHGDAAIDSSTGRNRLTADLRSNLLRLEDLMAVFGGAPRRLAGHTVSPAQAAMAVKLRAEHRLLPDTDLSLKRLQVMDAAVSYRADTVHADSVAVRALSMKIALSHGVLAIEPLALTLPQGQITGSVKIDSNPAVPTEAVDLKMAGATLESLIGRGQANPPFEGLLTARVKLSGAGNSVRAAANSADGTVAIAIPHGEIRQSIAELLGVNLTKGLLLVLTKSEQETPLRCAVADFHAQNGVLTARRMIMDTGVVLVSGAGDVNLRDETVNLRLSGTPKKFRLIRLNAPITLTGRLEAPKAGVDVSKAVPQLAIAGVLGAVVSPLAVLIPFVHPGTAKDADCGALLSEVAAHGAPVGR